MSEYIFAREKNISIKLYSNKEDHFLIDRFLKQGFYKLVLSIRETVDVKHFWISVDGREIGIGTTFFDGTGSNRIVNYNYPFVVNENGKHKILIQTGFFRTCGGHRLISRIKGEKREKTTPIIIEMLVVKGYQPHFSNPFTKSNPGQLFVDLWGWLFSKHYQRRKLMTIDYYKKKIVDEPYKWGANSIQVYPYFGDLFLKKQYLNKDRAKHYFTPDEEKEIILYAHSRGMLIDQHSNWARFEGVAFKERLQHLRWQTKHYLNTLEKSWMECVDGWETEEGDYRLPDLSKLSLGTLDNVIKMTHETWRNNPGAWTSICSGAEGEGLQLSWHPTTYHNFHLGYQGPNFIKILMCADGTLGNGQDDRRGAVRYLPEGKGFHNGYNAIYRGSQADCRFFTTSKFSGLSGPDWVMKQAFDFFRERAHDTEYPYESSIFWLGEDELTMPKEIRDYVYIASQDPLRSAVTMPLITIGRGGLFENKVHNWGTGTKYPKRIQHRCTSDMSSDSVIQNGLLRLTRSALGDKGKLCYDPTRLAHFDDNSLSSIISLDFLKTEVVEESLDFTPKILVADKWFQRGDLRLSVTLSPGNYTCLAEYQDISTFSNIEFMINGILVGVDRVERPSYTAFTVPYEGRYIIQLRADKSFNCKLRKLMLYKNGHTNKGLTFTTRKERMKERDIYNLYFKSQPGIYQLVFQAKGQEKETTWVTLDSQRYYDRRTKENKKFPCFSPNRWQDNPGFYGRIANLQVGKNQRSYVVTFNVLQTGKHALRIVSPSRAGLELEKLRIQASCFRHGYILHGGYRAILREKFKLSTTQGYLGEMRTYSIDNDTSYFTVEIDRNFKGNPVNYNTVISLPEHRLESIDGQEITHPEVLPLGKRFWFRSRSSILPDLGLFLLEAGKVDSVSLEKGKFLLHSKSGRKEKLKLGFLLAGEYTKKDTEAISRVITEKNPEIKIRNHKQILAVKNKYSIPLVRTVRIKNPTKGPYLVMENGWWMVRGGQPVYEKEKVDLLKVYLPAKGEVKILSYGFIEDCIRPGWGCQYTLAIGKIDKIRGGFSALIKILRTTPYHFAPRVELKKTGAQLFLNGKGWHYRDENLIFLPARPGEYRLQVRWKETDIPSIARTCASIEQTNWDNKRQTLSVQAGLPVHVDRLPEGLYYHALLKFDSKRMEISSIQGGKIAEIEGKGVIFRFKPGRIVIHFTHHLE